MERPVESSDDQRLPGPCMKRILIVDDEHLVADTLCAIFRNNGFDARAAYSTEEALRSTESFSPELLLCDITMPGRDGIQLMTEFGRALPSCQIVVLTGYHSNIIRIGNQGRSFAKPARILTKPCQPDELLREAVLLLAS